MARENLNDLAAFVTVAKVRSFTKAAAQMGVSQSALSHTIRALEERLNVRLLARTTRSVAPTEAGERLLATVGPKLEEIAAELAAVAALSDQPTGTIRISSSEHAAVTLLYPVIKKFMTDNPDVNIEISVDNAFTNIVEGRFDAGVRLGEALAKDMIAVPIGPDLRMAVVGAPAYFARYPVPVTPHDLSGHNCLNFRMPTYGNILPWEFEKDGRQINVQVEGRLTLNSSRPGLTALLDGLALGYLIDDAVTEYLADGRLIRVLDDWCERFPGFYLYYPSRRQLSPAFALLVEALRYRR
jgi:DNA-binding transcriptional LysR family regulator